MHVVKEAPDCPINHFEEIAYQRLKSTLVTYQDIKLRVKYRKILDRIERFVIMAIKADGAAFVLQTEDTRLPYCRRTILAGRYACYFSDMVEIASKLSRNYKYSELIELFRECCEQLDIFTHHRDGLDTISWCEFNPSFDPKAYGFVIMFNKVCDQIRRYGRSRCTLQIKAERKCQEIERHREYSNYVRELVNCHSRLVAIRVDLYPSKIDRKMATYSELDHGFRRMMANSRSNRSVFGGLVGYIVKFEHGIEAGVHAHAVFFFDGNVRDGRAHFYLAKAIGEYWIKVATDGRGDYYNCHFGYEFWERMGLCGIGLIRYDDENRIDNLLNQVVWYLCKPNSFARAIDFPKMRLIRRGVTPKALSVKQGRPRKQGYRTYMT